MFAQLKIVVLAINVAYFRSVEYLKHPQMYLIVGWTPLVYFGCKKEMLFIVINGMYYTFKNGTHNFENITNFTTMDKDVGGLGTQLVPAKHHSLQTTPGCWPFRQRC